MFSNLLNTEVGDNKASIATRLFQKTCSLEGELAPGKQEPRLCIKYILLIDFFKVKKGASQAL